jgi:type IV pilus assembly protein PilW
MGWPVTLFRGANWHSCRGLSLIELTVSLLLGSIFTLSIVGIYLHSKRHFAAEEALARMQENGRFSMNLMKRELMHAGFYAGRPGVGAMASAAISGDCTETGNWALDPSRPLELLNEFNESSADSLRTINGTAISCLQAGEIAPGTDVISIKRTAGSSTVNNGEPVAGAVVKNSQWYLRLADYGDNKSWHYHKEGGLPQADIGPLSDVDYWEFYARIFYIRRFSQSPGDGIPSLCVEGLSGGSTLGVMASRCVVEGVEDMQIEFGLDSDFDGVANQYKAAPLAAEIETAVAARIYLLLRSLSEIPGNESIRTYHLGSKTVTRSDRFMRRLFTTTVQIRNSKPVAG